MELMDDYMNWNPDRPRPALEAPKAPSERDAMPENAGKYMQTACIECGKPPKGHHKGRDGTLWCTEDGLSKGYGRYYGPTPAGEQPGRALRAPLCSPGVPLEGAKPAEVPENAVLYSAEPAMRCDGCGAWPIVTRYGDYPGTINGQRERFSLCAECARVLA